MGLGPVYGLFATFNSNGFPDKKVAELLCSDKIK